LQRPQDNPRAPGTWRLEVLQLLQLLLHTDHTLDHNEVQPPQLLHIIQVEVQLVLPEHWYQQLAS